MSMLDVHQEALNLVSEAYHDFLLRYKGNEKVVYGVVEGKQDPNFYKGLIEGKILSDWTVELIVANGRSKVISTYKCFKWDNFDKKRICFYLDRDFSDFLETEKIFDDNIYVTDMYSIENNIVNAGTFNRVLHEVLNINLIDDSERSVINNLFESSLNDFKEALVPAMSQAISWRRSKVEACLNDFDPHELFSLAEGIFLLHESYSTPSQILDHFVQSIGAPVSPTHEIQSIELEFRTKSGPAELTRGKYLFSFMTSYLLHIHENIPKIIPRYTKSPKINISLGIKNAMIFVAPRARCPQSLHEFIDKTYSDYINKRLDV